MEHILIVHPLIIVIKQLSPHCSLSFLQSKCKYSLLPILTLPLPSRLNRKHLLKRSQLYGYRLVEIKCTLYIFCTHVHILFQCSVYTSLSLSFCSCFPFETHFSKLKVIRNIDRSIFAFYNYYTSVKLYRSIGIVYFVPIKEYFAL